MDGGLALRARLDRLAHPPPTIDHGQPMLLTLATNTVAQKMSAAGRKGRALLEVPQFAIHTLGLRGLNIFASSLAGWSVSDLDALRDRADKAACPCLVLVDDTPLDLDVDDDESADAAIDRVRRLAAAANRLGCNSIAVSVGAPDSDDAFEHAAMTLRDAMPGVERLELNLLIMPGEGLTDAPDRCTDLIKRIGGFRIGSLPTFAHAAKAGDPIQVLRKLAPYAGAIHASVYPFTKVGKHGKYDLADCIHAVRAVGFTNTLAIEYLGKDDAQKAIERARDIMQAAIDVEQPEEVEE